MKSPAFQFYPDDFIAGTTEMSPAEVGAYIRLLCYQWGRGSIPLADEARLARIAGGEVTPDVLAKFPEGRNARLEAVRAEQEAYRLHRAAAGARGAAKRWQSSKPPGGENHDLAVVQFSGEGHPHAAPENGSAIVLPCALPSVADGSAIVLPMANGMANGMAKNGPPSPPPSPTPTLDPISRSKTVGRVGAAALPDAAWLESLKFDPAYAGLDVEREAAKCARWCATARKLCSRRRVVNWLNRCDRPLNGLATHRPPMMR